MAAKDSVPMAQDPHAVMKSYGQAGAKHASKEIEVIKTLGGSSETFLVTMGAVPGWWRAVLKRTPMFWKGGENFDAITGMAVAAISKRLQEPTDRNDLLSKLQAGKDEDVRTFSPITSAAGLTCTFIKGNPMGKEELTAEALTFLIAGSDTTAK